MTTATATPDPRAQYGTPLLYQPLREFHEAVADRFARLSADDPATRDIPPRLLRKAWLMRTNGGALRWWLRLAANGQLCRTPGGRGRLLDAFLAYSAARADLKLALLCGDRKGDG